MPQSELATFLEETQKQLHSLRKRVAASGHLDILRDIDSFVAMAEDDTKNLIKNLGPCADASPNTSRGPKSTDFDFTG